MLCLFSLALWMLNPATFAATAYHGQVTFNGLPVPGATVTATQGDKKESSITDQQGTYVFPDITDGAWKFQVQMEGFETLAQDVAVAAGTPGPTFELKLLPLAQITHGAPPIQAENELSAPTKAANRAGAAPPTSATVVTPEAPESTPSPNAPKPPANAKANATNANNTPPPAAPPAEASDSNSAGGEASSELQQSAATGLVVNGSVNNGAASPFSQAAAFGNNRRGPGLFYNGNAGVNFDTSAWDARNFSPGGLAAPKLSYNQLSILGNVGGPIGIPRHYFTNSNFVLNYQHGQTTRPLQ